MLFIPIGYVLLEQSNGVKEIVVQYDGEGGTVPSCVINSANANKMCQVRRGAKRLRGGKCECGAA